jgi:D-alanyl-D-alanine carboxypeptidase (penicillin-binding protein 5/6)
MSLLPIKPVHAIKSSSFSETTTQDTFTWPSTTQGEAALAISGLGLVSTYGEQNVAPTASTAKVMAALAVLHKEPLALGQQGPMLTMTAADVSLYNSDLAQDDSVVQVTAGEQISEYQALQALLLPSADNMADTLVTWAFGSVSNYLAYANQYAASLGMNRTHFADASGVSPQTVSTAHDLVILGETALNNPVLMQIAGQTTATVPVAGTIQNVNFQLGKDGIVGIKTGNTPQAGGCYLFAATYDIDSSQYTIVGAIMNAPDLTTAENEALPILQAAKQNVHDSTLVQTGQTVGYYETPWHTNDPIIASQADTAVIWGGLDPNMSVQFSTVHPTLYQGARVGSLVIQNASNTQTIPLILANTLSGPSISWRFLLRFV